VYRTAASPTAFFLSNVAQEQVRNKSLRRCVHGMDGHARTRKGCDNEKQRPFFERKRMRRHAGETAGARDAAANLQAKLSYGYRYFLTQDNGSRYCNSIRNGLDAGLRFSTVQILYGLCHFVVSGRDWPTKRAPTQFLGVQKTKG
jgi:hypothetical protein